MKKKEEISNILHSLKHYKEDLIKSGRIDESILLVNDILNSQSDDLKKAVVNAYLNLTEVIKNEDKTKMPVHLSFKYIGLYIKNKPKFKAKDTNSSIKSIIFIPPLASEHFPQIQRS